MVTSRRIRTAYYCTRCGTQHPRWQGQCRECNEWNCLVEERLPSRSSKRTQTKSAKTVLLSEIETARRAGLQSGIVEFDRVLGGNLLPGMTVLLGGDPGIGKSTLMLQAADAYGTTGSQVLYVTGEESLSQLKLRSARLGVTGDRITVLNETSLETILQAIGSGSYGVVMIDSIQTVASGQFDSPPGTVAQVRESAQQMIETAKSGNIALFLIGHVTKEGVVAGPKVLEHMVDTVLQFEGDSSHQYRLLRAAKNRFGSVAEIGVFEMKPEGLAEVSNPSSLFLSDHASQSRSGAVVTAICEGNRPILIEVQALVTPSNYGTSQRVANGFDSKRLAVLLAILEKRCDYPMAGNDCFVSVTGGLRLSEPALDLPIMTALTSSLLNRPVPIGTVVVGEVGLSGEVRGVSMADRRVCEAQRMGFERVVLPAVNADKLAQPHMQVSGVSTIQAALDELTG
ncbi:MAG: DNA repair protein RadA [Candidatus Zixiibacteriota bacterium]